jgi:thiol-disulfide isomerase/thioredoxin
LHLLFAFHQPTFGFSMQIVNSRIAASVLAIALTGVSAMAKEPLTIGSAAPPLKIEHWITDGAGKFRPIQKFETGKVYVIEFWATTCGPCVQSIPHLADLQDKYADQGVQIIGVTSEAIDEVNDFMTSRALDTRGKPTTIGDLAKKYSLTADPDGSTDVDYMLAAKQDSIPVAFIVGKDTKIEWFGHPMEMDDILEDVVKGKWDRKKYKEEQDFYVEIQSTISKLARQKKFDEAVKALDDFLTRTDDPRIQFVLNKSKIDMQVRAGTSVKDSPAVFATLFGLCKEEPMFAQDVAWTSYELFLQDQLTDRTTISAGIAAMKAAIVQVTDNSMKSNMFDTLSHLQYVSGQLDEAIASQAQAIALGNPGQKEEFEGFLRELKSQKK